jgi:hypothetical protein
MLNRTNPVLSSAGVMTDRLLHRAPPRVAASPSLAAR